MFKLVAASFLLCARFSGAVDIPIAWTVQAYEDITAQSGDTITFAWDGTHSAAIHPSGSCDVTGAIEVGSTSPATYTFTDADIGTSIFFACQVGEHCASGQHITVNVQAMLIATADPLANSTEAPGISTGPPANATDAPDISTDAPANATEAPFFCSICGDGNMVTFPDAIVTVPTQDDRTCSFYLTAAFGGLITEGQCPQLQPFTSSACGCVPGMDVEPSPSDGTPTPAPIGTAPTPKPVADSAVAFGQPLASILAVALFGGICMV